MAIEEAGVASVPTGWLEFDVKWLAGLFGLQATGEARVILGKVQVGVRDPRLPRQGAVVEGLVQPAILGVGWKAREPDS